MAAELQKGLADLEVSRQLSTTEAEAFLQRFSLADMTRALQIGEISATDLSRGLRKILASGIQVPELQQYAQLALDSHEPALRELAVEQIGRTIQDCLHSSHNTAMPKSPSEMARQLLNTLSDPDTGVAAAAKQSLENVSSSPEGLQATLGHPNNEVLRQLLHSPAPVTRLRALALVTTLASASPEAAAVVRKEGLLEALTKELSYPEDPLGCAAALQLVCQLALQSGPAALTFLGQDLLSNLQKLVNCRDSFLRSSALQASGFLLAAASAAGITDERQIEGLHTFVIQTLESCLSPQSEDEPEVVNAALVTVEQISSSLKGREMLAGNTQIPKNIAMKALGLSGRSDERIAAMHALSDLLGASRIDEECSTSNARLNTEAEDRLSDDIFSCAATTSLADTLSLRLKQPFEECRIAALRLISAIGLHPWGAREVCSHGDLLSRLCNAGSETTNEACRWRFSCIKLERSTRQGPYVSQLSQEPQVDVVRQ